MSKPEVSRRDENGDRAVIIHAYAPGDGDLSFVAATSAARIAPFFPAQPAQSARPCPEGWELYREGPCGARASLQPNRRTRPPSRSHPLSSGKTFPL